MRTRLAPLALAVAAVAALLGALELAAWALGLRPLQEQEAFRTHAAALACRFDPAQIESFCDPARWRTQPDPRKAQVLVLGSSSVAGYQNTRQRNIPYFMRHRLDGLQPGRFAVRSLALPCKDSIYQRRCALRALASQPAALVLYDGHNDFSGHTVRHPRLSLWMGEHGYPLFRLEQLLGHTRFWTLLATRGGGRFGFAAEPARELDPQQAARTRELVLATVLDNYARLIDAAAARDVPVVLVTVVSNLEEFPERRERWDAVLAEADAAGSAASPWLARYADGIRAERAGRRADALAAFAQARDARPLTRAPGMLNPALRQLAASRPNVVLLDFERELEQVGLREGIGCNFFGSESYCDGLHPNLRASEMIGRAAADAVLIELDRRAGSAQGAPR